MADFSMPTLQEELDRKSIEAIEYLVLKHGRGEISDDAYSVGIDVLFMTLSGIVDDEFIEIITAAGDELNPEPEPKSETIGGSW